MAITKTSKKTSLQLFIQPMLAKRIRREAKAAQLSVSEYGSRILEALANTPAPMLARAGRIDLLQ